MARHFIHRETGKRLTRVEIVELFEKEEMGRTLSAAEFEVLLDELEHFEITGIWRADNHGDD